MNSRSRLMKDPAIYVTATDTLPDDSFLSGPFPRITEEVDLGNGPVTYFEENNYEDTGLLAEASTYLITGIQAHYRGRSGLETTVGLFYSTYRKDQRLAGRPGLPEDYFLTRNESDVTLAGINTGLTYNFLRSKRFQPYAGIFLTFAINRDQIVGTYRQFPLLGSEQEIDIQVVERFRTNTILNFDSSVRVGANYRLTEKLAVGFTVGLWKERYLKAAGVQLRYLFSPK